MMNDKPIGHPNDSPDILVDSSSAKRRLWLVKNNAGNEVGQLTVKNTGEKLVVNLNNNSSLVQGAQNEDESMQSSSAMSISSLRSKRGGKNREIPSEHSLILSDVNQQSMVVLCEDKSGLNEYQDVKTGRLTMEGWVVKKADCRPPQTPGYLEMKIHQIRKSSQPKRVIMQIDKAEVKYKPIAIHNESIAKEKLKKEGAKAVRADKDVVRQALFFAFEKHQYYRLIDLQKLTNQPPGLIKDILTEIAVYNTAPPHKSMWELKPEYRNYRTKEASGS